MKSTWREKESDSDSNSSTTKRFLLVFYQSDNVSALLVVWLCGDALVSVNIIAFVKINRLWYIISLC